ncbi:MAG: hypothetical protein Gyms2KO_00680 [Gymnodinialimonas sp.]
MGKRSVVQNNRREVFHTPAPKARAPRPKVHRPPTPSPFEKNPGGQGGRAPKKGWAGGPALP